MMQFAFRPIKEGRDAMDGNDKYRLPLKPIGMRANGGRQFDPADKKRLVLECLKPGVSVAGIAVANGLNPNLVRKWITDHRKKQGDRQSPASPASSAFIEIVAACEPIKAISAFTGTEAQSVGHHAAAACVRSAGLFESGAPGDIAPEDVTPLLEASLDALTASVLKAMVERHPELDPIIVQRTLDRHRRLPGCGIDGGEGRAVEQGSRPERERMELPDIDDISRQEAGVASCATRMETSLSNEAKRYLRTDEAALFLGLSVRTMEKHRCYGTGPIYRKLGGRVVYALADLEHWANRGILSSTSDSTAIRAAIPKYRTNSPQVANDRRSANNDSCD
ncbi:hypothetical protein C5748_26445 [Phyllobacterium phragmitis]|uniref:Helix-turn-helix domain-containing protein n=2 Tax=Phyllobacterium phragmitis TaxID=2670329 RepID=A0A2S9IJ38_9HYPH|nr:hypothetical protein C5748_26445 [Phyllobacterium phragmitis]